VRIEHERVAVVEVRTQGWSCFRSSMLKLFKPLKGIAGPNEPGQL
jgi:hypothetical protein